MAKRRRAGNDPLKVTPVSVLEELQQQQATTRDGLIAIPSPVEPDKTLRFELLVLPHQSIKTRTTVHADNLRVQSLLSERTVRRILPEIKANGKNTHPAIGYYVDPENKQGDIVVLAGSRRRMACQFAEADFVILVCVDPITEEEAKAITLSSDNYEEPSLYEKGLFYKSIQDQLKADGADSGSRSIQKYLNNEISHTAIASALKVAELPENVIQLFPSPNFIGEAIGKKLHKVYKENEIALEERVREFKDSEFYDEAKTDDEISKSVLSYLISDSAAAKKPEVSASFNGVKSAKINARGELVLTFPTSFSDKKAQKQIADLLKTL